MLHIIWWKRLQTQMNRRIMYTSFQLCPTWWTENTWHLSSNPLWRFNVICTNLQCCWATWSGWLLSLKTSKTVSDKMIVSTLYGLCKIVDKCAHTKKVQFCPNYFIIQGCNEASHINSYNSTIGMLKRDKKSNHINTVHLCTWYQCQSETTLSTNHSSNVERNKCTVHQKRRWIHGITRPLHWIYKSTNLYEILNTNSAAECLAQTTVGCSSSKLQNARHFSVSL